jgi:hypothetical protein
MQDDTVQHNPVLYSAGQDRTVLPKRTYDSVYGVRAGSQIPDCQSTYMNEYFQFRSYGE